MMISRFCYYFHQDHYYLNGFSFCKNAILFLKVSNTLKSYELFPNTLRFSQIVIINLKIHCLRNKFHLQVERLSIMTQLENRGRLPLNISSTCTVFVSLGTNKCGCKNEVICFLIRFFSYFFINFSYFSYQNALRQLQLKPVILRLLL